VVAGIATLWRATQNVDKDYYGIVQQNGRDEDLEKARKAAFKERYFRKPMTDEQNKSITDVIHSKDPGAIQKAISKIVKERDEDNGIKPGVRGFIEKWRRIKPHHRENAILTVVTVSSIALGAIYSFNRETKLANKLHRQIAKHAQDRDAQQQNRV
jgi:hypothetical protein